VPAAESKRAMSSLEKLLANIVYGKLVTARRPFVKISAIGVAMRSHSVVAARAFKALAEKGLPRRAITTSESSSLC